MIKIVIFLGLTGQIFDITRPQTQMAYAIGQADSKCDKNFKVEAKQISKGILFCNNARGGLHHITNDSAVCHNGDSTKIDMTLLSK